MISKGFNLEKSLEGKCPIMKLYCHNLKWIIGWKYDKADTMKTGIIASAKKLGYDDQLYKPTSEEKQYATLGKYVRLAEELKTKELVSTGKYEELLLNGFRGDIVYGLDTEEEEKYDW